jgi:hypothetical protein
VEGKGRVFTRKLGKARSKMSRHGGFARAVDLELPLLLHLQHEIAPIGLRLRLSKRKPRFLGADGLERGRLSWRRALIRLSFT